MTIQSKYDIIQKK